VDLLNLEVDGSLANPYAAAAVAIWTVILGVVASVLVRSIKRSGRIGTKITLFIAAILITGPAQFTIGNVLYQVTHPGITSVCIRQLPFSFAERPTAASGTRPGPIEAQRCRHTSGAYPRSLE
jgi:hypothetical protein